jgi:hypothetical protein
MNETREVAYDGRNSVEAVWNADSEGYRLTCSAGDLQIICGEDDDLEAVGEDHLEDCKGRLVTFTAGENVRYIGMVLANHSLPLCAGDEAVVERGQECEPEDDVMIKFRGAFYNVGAEDLIWLRGKD